MKRVGLLLTGAVSLVLVSFGQAHAADFEAPITEASSGALVTAIEGELSGGVTTAFTDGDRQGRDLYEDTVWPTIVGDFRVSIPLMDNIALQADFGGHWAFPSGVGRGENFDASLGGLDWYTYSGGHLAYRDPSRFALGAFGVVGLAAGSENTGQFEDLAKIWAVGGEGQWYGDDYTLYLQGGFIDSEQVDNTNGYPTSSSAVGRPPDSLHDAWFIRGIGRYFLTPGSRFQGEISYADGNMDITGANDDIDVNGFAMSWEARYDHQFNEHGSYFVAYHGTHVEQTGPRNNDQCCEYVTDHTFLFGVRVYWQAMTLLEMDRQGVTFSMPDIGRWGAYTLEAVDFGN